MWIKGAKKNKMGITYFSRNFCFMAGRHFFYGSVKNFVALVKNGSFLVRITDMTILIEKELFMAVAKDQIRQIITENNITSVADVYSLLKDSFKDILQELLEAEMDATLGYEKIVRVI